MKFEKEETIKEEWVMYYSNDGKVPLASIKSVIQILFIIMFCLAYATYTQLSTLESVEIMKDYAEKHSKCNFFGSGGYVAVDCGTTNSNVLNYTN